MITIESTESIARSPADVFTFVADVRNDPQWHTDILEAQLTSGTLVANGTTFTTRFKPFMGLSEGTGLVTAYEPPHRLVIEERMGKLEPKTIQFPNGAMSPHAMPGRPALAFGMVSRRRRRCATTSSAVITTKLPW